MGKEPHALREITGRNETIFAVSPSREERRIALKTFTGNSCEYLTACQEGEVDGR